MFRYCCDAKPQIETVLEKDVDNLRNRIEEMKKQINNIYGLLEALTNESKKKPSFYLDKKNISTELMFNQKRYYNLQQQNQPTILAKVNSSYRKLEKAMKEPPREYEQIKKLVEEKSENIINIRRKFGS